MCFRRLSDCVYSQRSFQASSRVGIAAFPPRDSKKRHYCIRSVAPARSLSAPQGAPAAPQARGSRNCAETGNQEFRNRNTICSCGAVLLLPAAEEALTTRPEEQAKNQRKQR